MDHIPLAQAKRIRIITRAVITFPWCTFSESGLPSGESALRRVDPLLLKRFGTWLVKTFLGGISRKWVFLKMGDAENYSQVGALRYFRASPILRHTYIQHYMFQASPT